MLWETVEPQSALRERFGFDSLDHVGNWVAGVLGETWQLTVVRCSRMVISDQNAIVWVRSDRGGLVVKWSRAHESFGLLDASTRLLRKVAEQGIPVATPFPGVDGPDRVVLAGPIGALSVTVLPEITGDWLNVDDPQEVWAAGACLAELHRALGTIQAPGPGADPKERIAGWLAGADRGLAPEASSRLTEFLSTAPELDDQRQWVHNDFRAANILTRGGTIAAVLDFDQVRVDHRVNDLARASVYLGTRFTDWRPTSDGVKQTLRAGYESVRPLSPAEAQWLEILLLWHGLAAVPAPNDPAGWASALFPGPL
jgi:Ser/Thr protein kinase RdoA (MazF antagonist)